MNKTFDRQKAETYDNRSLECRHCGCITLSYSPSMAQETWRSKGNAGRLRTWGARNVLSILRRAQGKVFKALESKAAPGIAIVLIALYVLFHAFYVRVGTLQPFQPFMLLFVFLSAFGAFYGRIHRWYCERHEATVGNLGVAMDCYGRTASLRGRDFFGAVLQEPPADEVIIVVELCSMESGELVYNLAYFVQFAEPLGWEAELQLLVAPILNWPGTRDAYHRYESAPSYILTFDLCPRKQCGSKPSNLTEVAHNLMVDVLNNTAAYFSNLDCQDTDWPQSSPAQDIEVHALETFGRKPTMLPARKHSIPTGTKSLCIRIVDMRHPRERFILVEPPLRTQVLSVICRRKTSGEADFDGVVCLGESSKVESQTVYAGDWRMRVDRKWWSDDYSEANSFGQKWRAEDGWVLTPKDSAFIYLKYPSQQGDCG